MLTKFSLKSIRVCFYDNFDCYDKKLQLNSKPNNQQGKNETLNHTFREQKLDVEKRDPCKNPNKARKEIPPQAQISLQNGLLGDLPTPHTDH